MVGHCEGDDRVTGTILPAVLMNLFLVAAGALSVPARNRYLFSGDAPSRGAKSPSAESASKNAPALGVRQIFPRLEAAYRVGGCGVLWSRVVRPWVGDCTSVGLEGLAVETQDLRSGVRFPPIAASTRSTWRRSNLFSRQLLFPARTARPRVRLSRPDPHRQSSP